jgi:Ca2+/H+ antiporter, TMEM165/GDT1 family
MDALLSTLLSVFLAEFGDSSQILTAALAIRFRKDGAVIAGLALATLLNCTLSAFVGAMFDGWISEEPMLLFTAIAYLFAGADMVLRRRRVDVLENWKMGAFMTSFIGLFILQFGEKSQFLIAVNSASTDIWGFALAGGFLGIMAACVPAMFLQEHLAKLLPIRAIRLVGGSAFLLWGLYLAFSAFRII